MIVGLVFGNDEVLNNERFFPSPKPHFKFNFLHLSMKIFDQQNIIFYC